MVNIRFANVDDLTMVEQLAREIWPVAYEGIVAPEALNYMLDLFYNNTALRDQMQQQNHTFLMAELDGKPVGFAAFSTIGPRISKLQKLYVHQNTQGKGVGKELIDFIISHLQSQSVHTLRLNVNRQNKARFFYEKLGFVVLKEEDVDIGNGFFMVDYVMEKKFMS